MARAVSRYSGAQRLRRTASENVKKVIGQEIDDADFPIVPVTAAASKSMCAKFHSPLTPMPMRRLPPLGPAPASTPPEYPTQALGKYTEIGITAKEFPT